MNTIDKPSQPSPPARLSESAFRRFEKHIEAAVKNPSGIIIQTDKPSSVASQLRNAIASLYQYQWETTIPHGEFLRKKEAKELVVQEEDGQVRVGKVRKNKEDTEESEASKLSCSIIEQDLGDVFVVGVIKREGLEVLCALAEKRLLLKPLQVNATEKDVKELGEKFDVLFEEVENGNKEEWVLT